MKTFFTFVIMLACLASCDHLHRIDDMLTAAQSPHQGEVR